MKILFSALITLFSFVTLACQNFSGTYEGYDQENGEYYNAEIQQTGCSSIRMLSNNEVQTITTDNVERLILSKTEQTEIGEMKADVYARALFVNNSLRIFYKANVTVQGYPMPQVSSDVEFYFQSPTELVTVTTSMGQTETTVSRKIK